MPPDSQRRSVGDSCSSSSGSSCNNRTMGGAGNKTMSHRELSLALKAIVSREVRENSKAASATVAARLGGRSVEERHNRVGRAHDEEKLRAARLRAAKPGAVYGDAVKEANMRANNGSKNRGKKPRMNSFDPLR